MNAQIWEQINSAILADLCYFCVMEWYQKETRSLLHGSFSYQDN